MNKLLIMTLIMAGITYLLRVLPITLIRSKIKSPFLNAFFNYVPFAILGALTVPDIFYSTQNLPCALIGTAVALIVAYRGHGLLTVSLSAIFSVFLAGTAFSLFGL